MCELLLCGPQVSWQGVALNVCSTANKVSLAYQEDFLAPHHLHSYINLRLSLEGSQVCCDAPRTASSGSERSANMAYEVSEVDIGLMNWVQSWCVTHSAPPCRPHLAPSP